MTKAARPDRPLSVSGEVSFFDWAFVLSVVALLVLVGLTFGQYAVSNDEGVQHHYGELIIAYYRSGFTDRSVFGFDNLYLYGGLFDIVAVLLQHLLPFDLYDIRHLLSALTGIGGIVAAWATGRMIAGPRAGFIAAIALAICGVWYGGMFNHTKDVPFASAMMGATFFLLRATRHHPSPARRDVLWFGVLLGCALGLRATGLVMIGYFLAVVVLRTWTSEKTQWQGRLITGGRFVLAFIPAFVVGYVIMIATWPWAQLSFLNPIRAIFAFAHFHYPVRAILAGHVYLMSEVPRWYEPAYILIKLPLAVLIGAAGAAVSAGWSAINRPTTASGRTRQRDTAILVFTVVFPLLCQVVGHGPSFSGMRHFLFVVPPIATLAGIGIDAWLSALQARALAAGVAALATVATAFALDAATLARLHPYEYLFYNSLVGGLEGASRNYETDYWVNIMPEAVKDLERYIEATNIRATAITPLRYSVGVCGERVAFENEAKSRLQWTGDWSHADFFIAPTHMNCDEVLRGMTVSVIERLGVPIGVVKDLRGVSPQARWVTPQAPDARTASSASVPAADIRP
jgi:Dolichyl-phosphate-mannose-protein mannosyltransferase